MNPFHNLRSLLSFLGALVLLSLPTIVFADEVFVPLTSIPGIDAVTSNADSLSAFLNTVYRLCVGAAAVIAVIQITRAGVLYMVQDSYHSKVDAKGLIRSSIFGLLLVLAPTIVFGVIDPRILDLKLDASGLRLRELGPIETSNSANVSSELRDATADAVVSVMENCGMSISAEQEACIAEHVTDVGNLEQDCGINLTAEQRSCYADVLNVCSDIGSIYDGRQVPDDKKHCCAINNLYAHDSRGGYSVCKSEPPGEEVEVGSGQNADGTYYLNIPTTVGMYGAFRANLEDEEQECIAVAYGSYPTNDACLAAVSAHQNTNSTWTTLGRCQQETSNVRQVYTAGNIPWCSLGNL